MRILGVVRLSELTDETTSPERQCKKITQWADLHDHELVDFSEDLDVSGAVSPFDRPGLGKWLKRETEWDALCVAKFDRISRSVRDFANLIEWLQERKKLLICLDPSIDLSTPAGRAFANMLITFAQFEREMIASRVRDAFHGIRESGRWPGGSVPIGMMAVRDEPKGWRLVPDPEVVPVVQDMVRRYLEGKSFHQIAAWLNDEKIPTSRDFQRARAGQQQRDKGWTPSTVRKVLTSPHLAGHVLRDGKPLRDRDGLAVKITPLIPEADYAELTEALAGRKFRHRANASKLLDVVECLVCQSPLYMTTTYHNGKAFAYYMCQRKRTTGCPVLRIRADMLEPLAWEQFLGRAGNAEVRKRVVEPAEDHGAELAQVEEAMAHAEAQFVDGKVYQGETGAERFATLMQRLEERRDRLAALPSKPAAIKYIPTGQTVAERWETLDDAGRRVLMVESGYKIRVAKQRADFPLDGGLTAWFRVDADLARRAAAAAEGHAADVPVPGERYPGQHWRLGAFTKDGSFYWSNRVLITGHPAQKLGPGHDPSDEELAAMYSDQPHPPVKW